MRRGSRAETEAILLAMQSLAYFAWRVMPLLPAAMAAHSDRDLGVFVTPPGD